MLMRRAYARQTPGHDLAAFGNELAEQPVIFAIDVGDFLGAEFANLLAPEKFASTFAGRTAGAGTPATPSAAKARTISSSGTLPERPRGPIAGWRWCFRLFSHNAPYKSVAGDQLSVASQNLPRSLELATDH
jgi:hypothetical protein